MTMDSRHMMNDPTELTLDMSALALQGELQNHFAKSGNKQQHSSRGSLLSLARFGAGSRQKKTSGGNSMSGSGPQWNQDNESFSSLGTASSVSSSTNGNSPKGLKGVMKKKMPTIMGSTPHLGSLATSSSKREKQGMMTRSPTLGLFNTNRRTHNENRSLHRRPTTGGLDSNDRQQTYRSQSERQNQSWGQQGSSLRGSNPIGLLSKSLGNSQLRGTLQAPARSSRSNSGSSINSSSMLQMIAQSNKHSQMPTANTHTASSPSAHPLVKAMLAALEKDHLLDVTLIGKDGVRVKASSYMLAIRVPALEKRLQFEDDHDNDSDTADEDDDDEEQQPEEPHSTTKKTKKNKTKTRELKLGDYKEDVLKAFVEYCYTNELTKSSLKTEETAKSARGLVQLAKLAISLKFKELQDDAYQMARRLVNRHLPLATAVYNEASSAVMKEFEAYAIQTIEECPKETLLMDGEHGLGVRFLSTARLQDMFEEDNDLEDLTKIQILSRWADHRNRTTKAMAVVKTLADTWVELDTIDRIDLMTTVKKSGLFSKAAIVGIIKKQEQKESEMFGSDETERVVVEGAGLAYANGVYVRQKDRDGTAMYVMTNGHEALSLHRWGTSWGIAPDHDQSNLYYTCEVAYESDEVPFLGWRVGPNGHFPAPRCTWIEAEESEDGSHANGSGKALPACFANNEEALYGN